MNATQEVTNQPESSRFEVETPDGPAYIEYELYDGGMILVHTYVPEGARGKGIAHKMTAFALDFVQKNQLKLQVICPMVKNYMRQHSETLALLDKSSRVK